eukprot:38451_1
MMRYWQFGFYATVRPGVNDMHRGHKHEMQTECAYVCCWNRMQPILDFNTLQKLNVIDALCWLEIHFRCCDQKEIAIFDRWRCYPRYTYCQPSISCILNVHFNAFCFLMCNILAQSVH